MILAGNFPGKRLIKTFLVAQEDSGGKNASSRPEATRLNHLQIRFPI